METLFYCIIFEYWEKKVTPSLLRCHRGTKMKQTKPNLYERSFCFKRRQCMEFLSFSTSLRPTTFMENTTD